MYFAKDPVIKHNCYLRRWGRDAAVTTAAKRLRTPGKRKGVTMSQEVRHDLNGSKHDFTPTYNNRWPDRYLRAHRQLDYIIPQQAKAVYEPLIERCMQAKRKTRLKIIDVGCSYGINASLLSRRISLDELYVEAAPRTGILSTRDIEKHRTYFTQRPRRGDLSIIGLDPSKRAVQYAMRTGLIDAAVTSNLEHQDMSDAEANLIRDADLIISTGCIGYVTHRTFRRLYAATAASRPWVACFVMHPFSYDGIAETLSAFGLATQEMPELRQRQRRFSTQKEKRTILKSMKLSKMDDRYERSTSYIYASFHLSLPTAAPVE
ncbi:class I SAM-dependent methyltransferase [Agrobacterium arsenijevicii]